MPHTASDWLPLQGILHTILLSHKEGISEYALFNLLKSPPYALFTREALRDPLALFQSHFILFNALYQLQDTWLNDEIGLLHIHCSCIQHFPWQKGQHGVNQQDRLRAYYLDWDNLKNTDQSQVEALLESFWLGFSQMPNQAHQHLISQQQALEILSLTPPYSSQQLKQQYRKMLHKHHPDKGGNKAHSQQLQAAYEKLKLTCGD